MPENGEAGIAGNGFVDFRAIGARVLSARRRRAAYFPVETLAEGAWDLLLELHGSGKTGAAALFTRAGQSAATGTRWLRALAERGLVALSEAEGAATAVLTGEGQRRMDAWLGECRTDGLI